MARIHALAGAALLLGTTLAHADSSGTLSNTKVINVDVRADSIGSYLVTFANPVNNQPACATGPAHVRMTGNTSTPGGRAMLAAALLASTTGKNIAYVQGTGTCPDYAGYEALLILSQDAN